MIKIATSQLPYSLKYHLLQPNDWTCGPTVLRMLAKAIINKEITTEQSIELLQATPQIGTKESNMFEVLKGLMPSFEICQFHSPEPVKPISITANLRTDKDLFIKLASSIETADGVIVLYSEPHDNDPHYAIAEGLTESSIILCDPAHGPRFELPLADFLWRARVTTKTIYNWMLTIKKPHK